MSHTEFGIRIPGFLDGHDTTPTLDLTGDAPVIDLTEPGPPSVPALAPAPQRAERPSDRRRRALDLGLSLLAVGAGFRWSWFRAQDLDQVGVAGWLFFAIEVTTVLALWSTTVVVLGRHRRRVGVAPADPGLTLDVFVPVAGEPTPIVRRTLAAALALHHPATVYLCDDSTMCGADNAAELAALARELGVVHLRRTSGARGKAGNLNHALGHSNGDVVLVVDADHWLAPDAAVRLLGWFGDSDVAFVTTPQRFIGGVHDPLNAQEPVFYGGFQPGRDGHDLAFSTGNGVMYRRRSLAEVGGFSEWSIVEDLHTSMKLHAAGWRSVFVPEPVTIGLSPETTAEYTRQRLRWATDSLRILFFDNPLRQRGLSTRGRLHYLHVVGLYVLLATYVGLQLAPPLWQLARVRLLPPMSAASYLSHLGPWLLAVALCFRAWAGSTTGAVRTLRVGQLLAPISLLAVGRALRGRASSGATDKGRQPRVSAVFVVTIAPLALLAVTMGVAVVDQRPDGSPVALFWAAVLLVLGIGPALQMGRGVRWAPLVSRGVSVLAVAIVAAAVAVAHLGVVPPAGTFASFAPPTADEPVYRTNELGDVFVRGSAVASTPAPEIRTALEPGDGLYLGLTADELPDDPYGFDRWLVAGAQPQLLHWYQQWGSGETRFRTDWLEAADARGAVPMISWEAWAKPEGGFASAEQALGRLAPIAAGEHDDYIRQWAEAAADHGKPILLRPFHEMNGTWYPWSVGINGNTAEDFIAAWRHVHALFDEAGADNVRWVWSINTLAFYDEGAGVEQYYPGDDVVDWVATSAFNWADSAEWASWVDPVTLVEGTHALLRTFDKPIMLAEVSTGHRGGDATAWVANAMDHFATLEDLHAVVWFDRSYDGSVDFRLDDRQLSAVVAAVRADPSLPAPLQVRPVDGWGPAPIGS